MKTIKFILLTLILINLSCTNDSEDDLTEPLILNQNEPVTFNNVSSIFQNNCISCHSNPPVNGAPMSLINYNDIKDAVEKVKDYNLKSVGVFVKGVGSGREAAVRALHANGLVVSFIKDITPIPHNGCRAKKVRRV